MLAWFLPVSSRGLLSAIAKNLDFENILDNFANEKLENFFLKEYNVLPDLPFLLLKVK